MCDTKCSNRDAGGFNCHHCAGCKLRHTYAPHRDRRFNAVLRQSQEECARIMARDQRRGTGRTTMAVQAAVLAAALGKRVAYVCGTQHLANAACRIAADFIARSGDIAGDRISVTKDAVTFYCVHSGVVTGAVKFIGIDREDGFNRGVREECKYRIVRDHHCEELLAERARKQARADAQSLIKKLMVEHGIDRVYTTGGSIIFD